MEPKTNVVLVHGAWADGSSWSGVITQLEDQGFNVTAAQIPLTSLSDDIAVVRRLLAMQDGPTVLVGHSYGGAVITGAANDAPNVTALVYIAAFGLDQGESLDGLSKQGPATAGSTQIQPDQNGFLWIKREGFAQAFCADVDPIEARIMAAVQKPLSVASFTEKSGPPAWKKIPSWYLVSSNDQMIPPQAEEFMGKRMGATLLTVAASHASLVSRPKEVSDLTAAAAEATANQPARKTA
jgi:pimeloyl-ACP methyl ester carboxylesterase